MNTVMFKNKNIGAVFINQHVLRKRAVSSKPNKGPRKYTNTINLPKSKFEIFVKPVKRCQLDATIQKVCNFSGFYNWQRENVKGKEYILHDGPPYANGEPHMGHAINKILKDIVMRNQLLQGHKINYRPGWDCHGLPIELLALEKSSKIKKTKSPILIRNTARKFATDAMNLQRSVFKEWGCMADWSNNGSYFTYSKEYIKNEFMQFYNLYEKGFVYRGYKPVYWSPASKTALAEAELEYNANHVSTAVTFAVKVLNETDLYALVWTTTPWTLFGNQAVAYNQLLNYSIIEIPGYEKSRYILASDLIDPFQRMIKKYVKVVSTISVEELSKLLYVHPLKDLVGVDNPLPFVTSDHVTSDKGTGLVHVASAHGQEDFLIGKKHNFNIESIVNEEGKFTDKTGPFADISIFSKDVTSTILSHFANNCLIHTEEFTHSYPYDWRTKCPVIMRASEQWFINTDTLKKDAIAALKDVEIIPNRTSAGFYSMLESRSYWCISRQRHWGVPIPVVYDKVTKQPFISRSLINHYCKLLDDYGYNFWWEVSEEELAPRKLLKELNADPANEMQIEKGRDILDIWLDSGLSWSHVLESDQVADLYLEGIDQFTGWFQSSLLTSMALRGKPPYKAILVHGFAVDSKGKKMSKSVGNITSPHDIIYGGKNKQKEPPYGLDVLRWWVAAHTIQHVNITVSDALLLDSQQCVQKLRSVLRFLLGGIHDIKNAFDENGNEKSIGFHALDKYILHQLYNFHEEIIHLYNTYQYNKVCSLIINFLANEISALYFPTVKDRLYCDSDLSENRQAVQFTFNNVLNVVIKVIAPIVPVLAEELYSHHPLNDGKRTFFQSDFKVIQKSWYQPDIAEVVKHALEIRKMVAKEIPLNGSCWKMSVTVNTNPKSYKLLKVLQKEDKSNSSELVDLFQVASVTLKEDSDLMDSSTSDSSSSSSSSSSSISGESCRVILEHVNGNVCERCRKYIATVRDGDSDICNRCYDVVQSKSTNDDQKDKTIASAV